MLEQNQMGCPKLKIKSNANYACNTCKRILKPGWPLAKKIISDPHPCNKLITSSNPCNKKVIELILTARNGFETNQHEINKNQFVLKRWLK